MSQSNDAVRIRIRIAALLWIPIAIALICRYYVVQVKKHDYYFSEAKKRYTSVKRTIGRRGEILSQDMQTGGIWEITANVPLSNMFGYSTDLRSKTQGRGNYSMFFEKYEPVPRNVQEKVLNRG